MCLTEPGWRPVMFGRSGYAQWWIPNTYRQSATDQSWSSHPLGSEEWEGSEQWDPKYTRRHKQRQNRKQGQAETARQAQSIESKHVQELPIHELTPQQQFERAWQLFRQKMVHQVRLWDQADERALRGNVSLAEYKESVDAFRQKLEYILEVASVDAVGAASELQALLHSVRQTGTRLLSNNAKKAAGFVVQTYKRLPQTSTALASSSSSSGLALQDARHVAEAFNKYMPKHRSNSDESESSERTCQGYVVKNTFGDSGDAIESEEQHVLPAASVAEAEVMDLGAQGVESSPGPEVLPSLPRSSGFTISVKNTFVEVQAIDDIGIGSQKTVTNRHRAGSAPSRIKQEKPLALELLPCPGTASSIPESALETLD